MKSSDQSGFQEKENLPEISVTTWSTGKTEPEMILEKKLLAKKVS